MKLPIYLYGHPVLREETVEITSDYPELQTLIPDMWETMYDADGIGLAAPQIGKAIKLIVIDADPLKDEYPECAGFKRCFINARLIESGEDCDTLTEGCLSIPGISESVKRPLEVEVEYLDENFEKKRETLHGFAARVFQHEYDHINSTLFTDRITPLRKQMIKSKLNKISQGRTNVHYKTVAKPKR